MNYANMAKDVLKIDQIFYISKEVEENKCELLDPGVLNSGNRLVGITEVYSNNRRN